MWGGAKRRVSHAASLSRPPVFSDHDLAMAKYSRLSKKKENEKVSGARAPKPPSVRALARLALRRFPLSVLP